GLGAFSGWLLSKGVEKYGNAFESFVRWSDQTLIELTRQACLRYLVIAHFGRGQGEFSTPEDYQRWSDEVTKVLPDSISLLWQNRDANNMQAIASKIHQALCHVLEQHYPGCR